MVEETQDEMVRLVFIQPARVTGGAAYNIGDRAAFPPKMAEVFLRGPFGRGTGAAVREQEFLADKTFTGPPADRMIGSAPVSKGKR